MRTGCHLNLCHLCAPLLILRAGPVCVTSSSSGQTDAHTSESISSALLPVPVPVPIPIPNPSETRIPYNLLLRKACSTSPKSAKLAGGGFIAPQLSERGGEFRGYDLLPGGGGDGQSQSPDADQEIRSGRSALGDSIEGPIARNDRVGRTSMDKANRMGFLTQISQDGKVCLAPCVDEGISQGGNAKCLVCRGGVSGWLRVYTG